MSDKNYKQRTKVLGIPVVGDGDRISPEVELRKYQIIENMLLAGTQGLKNCLFTEGDLVLEKQADGKFCAVLRATSASVAATGIVSGSYFRAPSMLKWENLEGGKFYYLYLVGSPKTLAEHDMVRPVVSEFEQKDKQAVLVGIVNLKNGVSVLERYPRGKVYARDLGKHISDNENPHGESLAQDELIVKRIVLEDAAEVQIRHGMERFTLPALFLLPRVLDFVTAGKEGIVVNTGAKVSFAQVCRLSGGIGKLGEVSIGYFGNDQKISDNKSFVVYNDGDSGIPMRALIFFG
jgi:hypothetical protein